MVNIGSDDLLISSNCVFGPHSLYESVVESGSMGEEEGTAWGKEGEVKKLLVLTDNFVIFLS